MHSKFKILEGFFLGVEIDKLIQILCGNAKDFSQNNFET